MARRSETTKTSRLSPRGSTKEWINRRCCTRNRSFTRMSTCLKGATSNLPGAAMNLTLKVWRQKDARSTGALVEYTARDIVPDMSFLEMLDVVNEGLIARGEAPIAFDSDCREGICGTCALVINGIAHGGKRGTTVCQLHMRNFEDGQTIVIEPWRARPFPVLKDLITDRSPFDRIIQAGGFISVNTGGTPDANGIPVPKTQSERSMDAAACIGC